MEKDERSTSNVQWVAASPEVLNQAYKMPRSLIRCWAFDVQRSKFPHIPISPKPCLTIRTPKPHLKIPPLRHAIIATLNLSFKRKMFAKKFHRITLYYNINI